jgi:hypothetical protein
MARAPFEEEPEDPGFYENYDTRALKERAKKFLPRWREVVAFIQCLKALCVFLFFFGVFSSVLNFCFSDDLSYVSPKKLRRKKFVQNLIIFFLTRGLTVFFRRGANTLEEFRANLITSLEVDLGSIFGLVRGTTEGETGTEGDDGSAEDSGDANSDGVRDSDSEAPTVDADAGKDKDTDYATGEPSKTATKAITWRDSRSRGYSTCSEFNNFLVAHVVQSIDCNNLYQRVDVKTRQVLLCELLTLHDRKEYLKSVVRAEFK